MVDAGWLECKVRCWCGDVLGICTGLEGGGEAQKAEHLVSDCQAADTGCDGFYNARDIGTRNQGEIERRLDLRGHVGHSLTRVPVRRVDADGVHGDQDLTRPWLGNRRLLVTQHLGTAEVVQSDGPH